MTKISLECNDQRAFRFFVQTRIKAVEQQLKEGGIESAKIGVTYQANKVTILVHGKPQFQYKMIPKADTSKQTIAIAPRQFKRGEYDFATKTFPGGRW